MNVLIGELPPSVEKLLEENRNLRALVAELRRALAAVPHLAYDCGMVLEDHPCHTEKDCSSLGGACNARRMMEQK